MKDMKINFFKSLAEKIIKLGQAGAVVYSIPIFIYEPKVPESLLEDEVK